ncbi:hypothetical protein IYW40_15230 [Methylocystis sp. H4A]|uniref:hypothetical protein n=1 Tax=Methylocystis sp. H4A TaxID=2785788 RepID=UPI001A24E43E|nr:hypothetical protein [Methylocystis sp. H4A]MBG0802818.1 hypothetical protein [Methylocystis sp. H4A]
MPAPPDWLLQIFQPVAAQIARWTKGIFEPATLIAVLACIANWITYVANETASKRTLRAYLVPNDIVLQCPDCTNSGYVAPVPGQGFVELKNLLKIGAKITGQTPAYGVRAQIHWRVIPSNVVYPRDVDYGFLLSSGRAIESRIAVAPGEPAVFTKAVDVSLFSAAKAGEKRLIVYGTFNYEDVFGDEWESQYCWVYQPVKIDGSDRFTSCPEHNSERPAK